MAPRYYHRQVVLIGIESTYGTALALTGSANAILTRRGVEFIPLEGSTDEIDNLRVHMGAQGERLNQNVRRIRFQIDAGPPTALGLAPSYSAVLRACGLAEVLQASTRADYNPISTGFSSATIMWNDDGTNHVLRGARGTLKLVGESGRRPYFEVDFVGLPGTDSEVSLPATTLTGYREPVPLSVAGGATFTLHGYNAVLERIEIDLGNRIEPRMHINAEEVLQTGRKTTGTALIEADQISAINWRQRAEAST
jgi:hypothetical protein